MEVNKHARACVFTEQVSIEIYASALIFSMKARMEQFRETFVISKKLLFQKEPQHAITNAV